MMNEFVHLKNISLFTLVKGEPQKGKTDTAKKENK